MTAIIRRLGYLAGWCVLSAPTAITGGIAEALIATAFGLGIAIAALLPFNYLNARTEQRLDQVAFGRALLDEVAQKPEEGDSGVG